MILGGLVVGYFTRGVEESMFTKARSASIARLRMPFVEATLNPKP